MTQGEPATPSAAEVCSHFELGQEARALLGQRQTPNAFFSLLIEQRHYSDAIRFAAHLLPKRQAVWWGCLCVWDVLRPEPDAKQSAALQATVRWVLDPSEAQRRVAESAGKAAGPQKPAGVLALAAFYSDGSISRPDLPAVPAPPFLTARTVAAAVLLAAKHGPRDQTEQRYLQFLHLAVETGKNWQLWQSFRK